MNMVPVYILLIGLSAGYLFGGSTGAAVGVLATAVFCIATDFYANS